MTDKKNENNIWQERLTKEEQQRTEKAFEQAEEDIEKDPDMQPDINEDLDEGELARKEGHP
ncbi:MAG TPA: hypothetical protein VN722_06335 [Hanamia sp.]|nr:hypothetical protein [Hanamia sp.]